MSNSMDPDQIAHWQQSDLGKECSGILCGYSEVLQLCFFSHTKYSNKQTCRFFSKVSISKCLKGIIAITILSLFDRAII